MCTINVRYPNLSGTQAWTTCTVYGQSEFRTVVTSLDHLNKTKKLSFYSVVSRQGCVKGVQKPSFWASVFWTSSDFERLDFRHQLYFTQTEIISTSHQDVVWILFYFHWTKKILDSRLDTKYFSLHVSSNFIFNIISKGIELNKNTYVQLQQVWTSNCLKSWG